MMRTWLTIVVLASAGGLAGCGGGDEGTSGGSTSTTTAATAPPVSTREGATPTTTAAAGATTSSGTTGAAGAADLSAEERAFGGAFQTQCARFKGLFADYTERFRTGLPDDPDAVVRLFRSRTSTLLDQLRGFYRGLAAVDAPAGYETFADGLDRLLPQVERRVDRAERIVDGIETIDDVRDDAKRVQSALSSLSAVAYPPAFRTVAPACLEFG